MNYTSIVMFFGFSVPLYWLMRSCADCSRDGKTNKFCTVLLTLILIVSFFAENGDV